MGRCTQRSTAKNQRIRRRNPAGAACFSAFFQRGCFLSLFIAISVWVFVPFLVCVGVGIFRVLSVAGWGGCGLFLCGARPPLYCRCSPRGIPQLQVFSSQMLRGCLHYINSSTFM
ncbi:hypothetical protein DFH07DRAFT_44684 [Mycena maculata]|uniref:Transmembrane protein n=1 Tax=Mycena maculata TaxID=230809 RepID=A0AAD7N1Z6_9AGAR|nr:hypothetical protein DFH07DRAFT_44684 [Mycena maculata]